MTVKVVYFENPGVIKKQLDMFGKKKIKWKSKDKLNLIFPFLPSRFTIITVPTVQKKNS